ncbi:hypothetical protein T492DRAFT_1086815 [Pavlovales sp. CCMP2436]|nr:hypothetical protein T492DRAFT_1086815 [Pavlovales sp. CCMP2436]|mmetsp:Transcript_33298/g.82973  ORF Transcript_33298/g.82973 Transcript_33298/m.82973 type:complete len:270 (-) Transcript_33298:60-869(-)
MAATSSDEEAPVVDGAGFFFEDEPEEDGTGGDGAALAEAAAEPPPPPPRARSTAAEEEAAPVILRACRLFLARRELGERLYAQLEADLAGRPRPAALRTLSQFPQERLPAIVALQRHFRGGQKTPSSPDASGRRRGSATVGQGLALVIQAIEEAGLSHLLDDESSAPAFGRALIAQLDEPFTAKTAACLSVDDLQELSAVLQRNIDSISSDLVREQQLRADLSEQCERRERLVEQIVFRVGKHYRPRKQGKQMPLKRAVGPARHGASPG